MRLKNILLVVEDIEKSVRFYKELFGLQVVNNFDGNVIMTEGLVLQERKIWEVHINRSTAYCGHDAELFFVDNNLDDFLNKLENGFSDVEYVNPITENDRGQRVIRIYDLDKHLIEIVEDLDYVVRRLLKSGINVMDTAKKTQLSEEYVKLFTENSSN